MQSIIIKCVILYVIVVLSMRLMGKRQVGEMQPYELSISIMIAELAATPLANTGIPISYGIIPVLTLLFLHTLLSFIGLKSTAARKIICGRPAIIINKGSLDRRALNETDINMNDVMEQIRAKDITDISQIYYAIVETNGKLSIILKPAYAPLTPKDMGLVPQNKGFYYTVIMDGKMNRQTIEALSIDEQTILKLVYKANAEMKEVIYATVNEAGEFYMQTYSGQKATDTVNG